MASSWREERERGNANAPSLKYGGWRKGGRTVISGETLPVPFISWYFELNCKLFGEVRITNLAVRVVVFW